MYGGKSPRIYSNQTLATSGKRPFISDEYDDVNKENDNPETKYSYKKSIGCEPNPEPKSKRRRAGLADLDKAFNHLTAIETMMMTSLEQHPSSDTSMIKNLILQNNQESIEKLVKKCKELGFPEAEEIRKIEFEKSKKMRQERSVMARNNPNRGRKKNMKK